ncbi:hypothetical protein DPMN_066082 [Dreissena polymorpha]|uniref:Uncharacterized protein n=1 Tax=Dreissena polymorpha TaxID=45954 RepID=A0A9D3YYB2_DREPO|nr:hypothetical protein DPMN_066082 [Dreissena polymorpha]
MHYLAALVDLQDDGIPDTSIFVGGFAVHGGDVLLVMIQLQPGGLVLRSQRVELK